jgi:glycosyltransferase involved in cell wall biosynthesis
MLTILLPTANRPAMLRTALQSIADQTALARITRVVVSENSGSRASEAVCASFPQLPITYTFRRQALTPLEHGRQLMNEYPESPYTAILHDDDWWTPIHLANALAALEANPDSPVYGCGHFVVSAESSMLNCSGNLFPWFGSNYAAYAPWWKLSRLNVLMAELLGTVSHYSTLVARTPALREASSVFETGNIFDNDRMIVFALSGAGPLLFNPTPEVYVRNHGVQDTYLFPDNEKARHMCGTTRWLVETSGRPWDAIVHNFSKRMAQCPAHAMPTLRALAKMEWCLPEMQRNAAEVVLV